MKTVIFNQTKEFPGKVNFIDSENVILGYDLYQSCCEDAFWVISKSEDGSNPLFRGDETETQLIELDGYVFDPDYFKGETQEDRDHEDNFAIFKLVKFNKPQESLYIRLENHHNGYYSHGFKFSGYPNQRGAL